MPKPLSYQRDVLLLTSLRRALVFMGAQVVLEELEEDQLRKLLSFVTGYRLDFTVCLELVTLVRLREVCCSHRPRTLSMFKSVLHRIIAV